MERQESKSVENNTVRSPSVFVRVFLVLIILAIGVVGFIGLKKLKKPPRQKAVKEPVLAVEAVEVHPVNRQVVLTGYGEVTSRTKVALSSEVSGRVTAVHNELEAGATLGKGEVLLRVDDRDYTLDYQTAVSRLKVLRSDLKLAQREFDRVSALYRKNKVGTLSALEQAEKTVNSIANQISQVQRDRDLALLKIERCVLRAPFDSRITEVSVEVGEYVTIGKHLVSLVDDSNLELEVALDSRDAARWLMIDPKEPGDRINWFGKPEPVECTIHWTEDAGVSGRGILQRIVRFDRNTRTVVVMISLTGSKAASFPLTEGMFCKVEVPGKSMQGVYILPRQSVTLDHTVYRIVEGRLKTTDVKIRRMKNGEAYISEGLQSGDTVITTRLENPLEGIRVQSPSAGGKQ